MTSYYDTLSNRLAGLQSVLNAGKQLQEFLREDQDYELQNVAANQLESAAQQYHVEETHYRTFKFSELETNTIPDQVDQVDQEQTTEEVLTSVLLDLQVSGVLIAAGGIRGETGEKQNPTILDDSLCQLEYTVQKVTDADSNSKRFKFTEEADIPEQVPSSSLVDPRITFNAQSQETLELFVGESQETINSIFKGLAKFGPEKINSILSVLGSQVQEIPKLGRLISQGIQMMEGAISSLQRLLDKKALSDIKDKLQEVWIDLTEGESMQKALAWIFGIELIQDQIHNKLSEDNLDLKKLDSASEKLIQLQKSYQEIMAILQSITSVVSTGSLLLPLVAGAIPQVTGFIVAIYGVLLSVVIFVGMDYADSSTEIGWVYGAGKIIQSI